MLAGGAAAAYAFRQIPLAHPRAVVRSIAAAALRQKSVHWTEAGSYSTSTYVPRPPRAKGPTGWNGVTTRKNWRSTSDVTANSGVQRVTISYARGGPVKAEIRLVDDTVYVKGNVRALKWMALGVTLPQAFRYAGRWISVPKSQWHGFDPQTDFSAQLTLADLGNELKGAGDYSDELTAIRHPWDGTQVVSGEDDGSEEWTPSSNLLAHTGAEPLPIAINSDADGWEHGGSSSHYVSSGQFSRWNEPVHVIAPKHAVPLATVRGR